MRHECRLENVLGLGDSWAMSGGQWGAERAYGPAAPTAAPCPSGIPARGSSTVGCGALEGVRPGRVLEASWPVLAPELRGKIHIWVGEADDYFLNNAVHRLDEFLSRASLPTRAPSLTAPAAATAGLASRRRSS